MDRHRLCYKYPQCPENKSCGTWRFSDFSSSATIKSTIVVFKDAESKITADIQSLQQYVVVCLCVFTVRHRYEETIFVSFSSLAFSFPLNRAKKSSPMQGLLPSLKKDKKFPPSTCGTCVSAGIFQTI